MTGRLAAEEQKTNGSHDLAKSTAIARQELIQREEREIGQ
jgi:hypothetical protein